MTVATQTAGLIVIGNGVTTVFPFNFAVTDAADIFVSTIAGAVETPVSPIAYVVTLSGTGEGGNVTFTVAPLNGVKHYIYRSTPQTQLVSVSSQQRYDPEVVENVWDKLTFLIQELAAEVATTVRTTPGEDPTTLVNQVIAAGAAVSAGNVGLAPDGTLALPGYAFALEPGLGFRRPSAGLLQTVAGGVALTELSSAALRLLVPLVHTVATVTGGTNAQGQGPMTAAQNTVTSTPNNPSGVTLPAAVAGRRVVVANRGTNPINIYPASGAQIAALAVNLPVQLAVGQVAEFFTRSATQWEGQLVQPLDADLTEIAAIARARGMLIRGGAAAWEGVALGAAGRVISSDGTDVVYTDRTPQNPVALPVSALYDFTGIPSWANRLMLMLNAVQTNGTSPVSIQLGTSGGVENTAYGGTSSSQIGSLGATVNLSGGFSCDFGSLDTSGRLRSGVLWITRSNTNTWIIDGGLAANAGSGTMRIGGTKTLAGALDRLRITTVGGANNFSGGVANLVWD